MKPKQLYFILLGLLGALLLICLAVFILGNRGLGVKIGKLQRLSSDIALETGQIKRLQSLQADYQQNAPLAAKVQSILPSQKDQSEVIALISKIVASKHLALSGLTFDKTAGLPNDKSQTEPAKIPGIFVMPVKFDSSGSYAQLQSLLQSFETQQRYMRVSTIDISKDETSSKLSFSVNLEVFLRQ